MPVITSCALSESDIYTSLFVTESRSNRLSLLSVFAVTASIITIDVHTANTAVRIPYCFGSLTTSFSAKNPLVGSFDFPR